MAGWTEIESTTLASPAASVSFTTGLGGYAFFRLTVFALKSSGTATVIVRLNNDSGTNYAFQQIAANSTTITGARSTTQSSVGLTDSAGWDTSQGTTAMFTALIAKPSATVKAQAIGMSNYPAGTPGNTSGELNLIGGEWANTADAISRIDVLNGSGDFAIGSTFLLEGLAT